MSSYKAWIAAKRAEALDRGGRPLRNLPGRRQERFRWAGTQASRVNRGFAIPRQLRREPGEIVNPITGELVNGCLTVSEMARATGLSPHKLTNFLERLGIVQRVLACKDVAMITAPELVKPLYYHTPEVTRHAVERNLAIPIKTVRSNAVQELILITRQGQHLVQDAANTPNVPRRRVDRRRAAIGHLLRQGLSQAEIVKRTSLPKQTVSRHVRTLRRAA